MLAYLIIFANMYKSWKVKFVQLWGEKKKAVTLERRKGRQSTGVTQEASQHMVAFTAWLVSTTLAWGSCISCTESVSQHTRVRPWVTAVGRIVHPRQKPSRSVCLVKFTAYRGAC